MSALTQAVVTLMVAFNGQVVEVVTKETYEQATTRIKELNDKIERDKIVMDDHLTTIAQLREEKAQWHEEKTKLEKLVADYKISLDDIKREFEGFKQAINGRTIAKTIETDVLKNLMKSYIKLQLNSLKQVMDFLEKVVDCTLAPKEQQRWDKIPLDVQQKTMAYYTANFDELDELTTAILAVKDSGNDIAHPTNICSEHELLEFYKEDEDKLEYIKTIYAYKNAHNI
jgi:chromosome segregation ATPase